MVKTKILDCTIRDGGHLNKWNFDIDCVVSTYHAAQKSGTDYFEIGYRYPLEKAGLGPFGYCLDEFLLQHFHPSPRCRLGVMIDAGKCEANQFAICEEDKTPVQVVRVAAYPYELKKAVQLVEELHGKGYEVFINLMASSELTEKEYAFLRSWKSKHILTSVNFADSFGSFLPSDISCLMGRLNDAGFEQIGFHAHNSLQLGFANTIRAIDEGAVVVDASIYGMGRGSGNLPIEILIGYFEKMRNEKYNTVPYLDVIDRYYLKIFEEVRWGYNIKSLMGGLSNIHPYYVENLFAKKVYTVEEMWNVLQAIKERCPISFSPEKLDETLESRFYTPLSAEYAEIACRDIVKDLQVIPAPDATPVGEFALREAYKDRKFLIIATGPSIPQYRDKILEFIHEENCITIGVNNLQGLFEPEYHVFVSRKRFQQYARKISERSTLLVPSFFGKSLLKSEYQGQYYFFDLVAPSEYKMPPVIESVQHCVNINVAVSAMLLAYTMGASEIFAVGMDGYADEFNKKLVYFYNEDNKLEEKEVANLRYEMLVMELERVNSFLQKKSRPFFILTPTSHKKYYLPFGKR